MTWHLVKTFKRRNLSELSSMISDDDRQNNLLKKAKVKFVLLSALWILAKPCHQWLQKTFIRRHSTVFKDLNLPFSTNESKSNQLYNALLTKYKELLLNLFNYFLERTILPSWKTSLIIFIPKANNFVFAPLLISIMYPLAFFEKIAYLSNG